MTNILVKLVHTTLTQWFLNNSVTFESVKGKIFDIMKFDIDREEMYLRKS